MMLGVFFGQYFINITRSFTGFPIYLVQEKGMSVLKVVWLPRFQHCVVLRARAGRCLLGLSDQTRFIPDCARKLPIVLGIFAGFHHHLM